MNATLLLADARSRFDLWLKAWRAADKQLPETLGYCEGNLHAWAEVLNALGEKTACACEVCSEGKGATE